jgi:uncharacterized membrane protein HdeD (DUF308 family)
VITRPANRGESISGPIQWALTARATLAMLFGLAEGAMLLFAFWAPRLAAALMTTFFIGFALLDGLVALAAAGWGLTHGGRWRFLACKGATGVVAGIAAMLRPPGQKPGPLAIFAGWAIVTGLLQALEALALGDRRGRPLLAATAVLSVGFGVLVVLRPPQDVMTVAVQIAAYGLLLGILRLILALRLESPDLV